MIPKVFFTAGTFNLVGINIKYAARIIIKHFYANRYVINHEILLLSWVIVISHKIKIDDFQIDDSQ